MDDMFKNSAREHLDMMQQVEEIIPEISSASDLIVETLKKGGVIYICGNGGSAADSQHFAAELRGRFEIERRPLSATALTVDSSSLTAIGNDYGYDEVFSRQLAALGKPGDVLIAISTSGKSKNILRAVETAKDIGIKTITISGKNGGELAKVGNHNLVVRSNRTSRIQEGHIFIIHLICEHIDSKFTNG